MTDEMKDEAEEQEVEQEVEQQIDPVRLKYAIEGIRSEQNLGQAILSGAVGALVGAGLWAAITVVTKYQIGFMAVGVGFLVGFLVRKFGKGLDWIFGVVGAVFALIGCLLGNILVVCALISSEESIPLMEILAELDLKLTYEILAATFNPMDLLFYGIALYVGYKLSFRQFSEAELEKLMT
jgi:hypothetical protein